MNKILEALARLASYRYQQELIIDGTKDEYVLADQLLDEAVAHITTMLKNPVLSKVFEDNQLEEFSILVRELEQLSRYIPFEDESVSNEDLVLHNHYWVTTRNLVSEFLRKRGFDLVNWEDKNCKKSADGN